MRPIDADALVEKCGSWYTEEGPEEGFIGTLKSLIDEQPTIGDWISVEDRLPVETHSIFRFWYGKKEWSKAMWREQSDKVLVTVAFKDGTRTVTTGETHDGVWNTTVSRTLEPVVTHWMPMPEPPEEKK